MDNPKSIAASTLECVSDDSREFEMQLSLGSPEFDPDVGCFRCAVVLRSPGRIKTMHSCGDDTLQAVSLSFIIANILVTDELSSRNARCISHHEYDTHLNSEPSS